MAKRLLLFFMLAVLGAGSVCAAAPLRATAAPFNHSEFDRLVAEAKQATMADPNAGLEKARAIVALAESQAASVDQQQALATGLWLEAEALTRTNQISDAQAVLTRAIAIASADHHLTSLDGNLALSLGRVARDEGDVALALKSYQNAHRIFLSIVDPRGQSMALQGLGTIYDWARDYPREISYYNQAEQVYSAEPAIRLSIANNLGFALRQAGRNEEALKEHQRALALAKTLHSPYLQARILTNIAAVEVKLRNYAAGQVAANQALALLRKTDSDSWAPFVWGVIASIDYERGRLTAAETDLERAFRNVDLKTTSAPFKEFHELAYKVFSATGKYPLALAHLEAFKRLEDEGNSLTTSANLALMSARFDFTNQALEIEHLKTEQLRRDASLRESRAAVQRLILISAIAAALMLCIWLWWRHRLLREHQTAISKANVELTRILGERDLEIVRRTETEANLRIAMAAAEQANRAKTMFLANMSHELRTPLNAIIGFSELLATGAMPAAKVREYSNDINESGQNLLAILGDILDTARLDAGSVSLTESEILVAHCVEDALAKAGRAVDMSQKEIVVTGDRALRVRADEQRLVQTVEKVLANAAKFTATNGRIEIDYQRAESGGIDIIVSDDGVGIPPEKIESALERFGQIESPYARAHGGIGLGLPIAKSLIALHGGTLTIRSEVDKGTSVRVHLPAERDLDAPATSTTAAA